ncbi:trehalase-like [Onthophagus taurus]|uniref:trehalase-like n=1 Tax=Onthophagus taurus TaxID=166361 RepID=UPI0039BE3AB9
MAELRLLVFLAIIAFAFTKSVPKKELPPSCDSKIYCQGDLLNTVQMARVFPDSKTFVDLSLSHKKDEVLKNFEIFMENSNQNPNQSDVKKFVGENFVEGKELENWVPHDYNEHPNILNKISDASIKNLTAEINARWPKLGRKVVEDVKINPNEHSLIYVPNGFIIPGGRFKEFYYWDSYWIVRGLLICEMYETAKGILGNFLSIVDKFGFIPNGGRVYYLQRSQPPLLTKMVKDYYDATKDLTWVSSNIEIVIKELEWWLNKRFVSVNLEDKSYRMAAYTSASLGPRPESYSEDIATVQIFESDEKKQYVFNQLKSAAESGFDFSTRWIFDENGTHFANISFTETSRVIPVDLNAILYGAFNDLSYLCSILSKSDQEKRWKNEADSLKDAISNVLWDENDGIWYDFDNKLKRRRAFFAASNLAPLWTQAYDTTKSKEYGMKAAGYLVREKITSYKGGIPTTLYNSNEQWDFPNAWPPLQSIVVNGLRSTEAQEAMDLAKTFAENFVEAARIGFERENAFFEKYDAVQQGQYGGGGEYQVQTGFGWTNGVVLEFIDLYFTGNKET